MKYFLRLGLLFSVMMATTVDGMTQTTKQSTANSRVRVLDTAFYIPQLKRHRRIWICLPRDYQQTKQQYPLLYLLDGQNIFDTATSFSGEWGVDEAMDSLGPRYGEAIIVAVDNGGDKRLSEYSPFDFTLQNGKTSVSVKAEGDAFATFLVQTLRPYLEKNFRVKPDSRQHFVAGSSMGALLALHSVMQFPEKWGGAGIFSPAFWTVRVPLMEELKQKASGLRQPLYFYAGQKEGAEMVPDMQAVLQVLETQTGISHTSVIRAEGRHDEATWRKEFPQFYQWMMERVK
ncbi:Predicted hydrolase of the alpha/beta superfamily [Cnuella takakiae]|uniref:Predicted hydrolase of the alpha/beta superfamily n=1 Tax=Cnuella takakiae TaxID=1302690 RepID=A0A1M5ILE7_9BACT|nr:alpha/beta hydrolase-fold protein [Cnuella takakiae]OLY92229.1 hypothetical protein BUE76_10255 [Cnuella takakiae]SHG29085.1 Predicted hydrolase of the alpha/beta superfamily [Cnuella takakiae]